MSGLVLILHFADGSSRADQSQPDTIAGRHAIDRLAWELLARPEVERIEVKRVAETRPSRRSYR
jgi:hypothetical protein